MIQIPPVPPFLKGGNEDMGNDIAQSVPDTKNPLDYESKGLGKNRL